MDDFVKPLSEEVESIFFIEGEQNARYPYSHSILIEDYLIDTGISHKRLRKLKKLFPINNVILSHWHEDHISGNALLDGVMFYCHSRDKPVIENIRKMIPYYGVENSKVGEELKSLIELLGMKNIKG